MYITEAEGSTARWPTPAEAAAEVARDMNMGIWEGCRGGQRQHTSREDRGRLERRTWRDPPLAQDRDREGEGQLYNDAFPYTSQATNSGVARGGRSETMGTEVVRPW